MAEPLDEMSYFALLELAKKRVYPQAESEILRRKNKGERPKVRGFKNHKRLSELQNTLLKLLITAITEQTEMVDTPSLTLNFAKHSSRGGWVTWLTADSEQNLTAAMRKIRWLRLLVEEEKERFGLCRIYLIPVKHEKGGWEGFKIRLDRGTRLVYEDV